MLRRFPRALLVVVFACLPACGDVVPAEEAPACADAATADVAAHRAADDLPLDRIVIPMQPLTEGPFVAIAEIVESEATPRLQLDATVTLAVADGYPEAFTVSVPQPLWAGCGPLEGTVTLHEVSGGSEAISVALLETGIALAVQAVGTADTSVTGEITLTKPNACGLPLETPIPMDLSFAVRAVRPVDVVFQRPYGCEGEVPMVAPSMPNAGLRPQLRDEYGAPMNADNAAWDAQVTVALHGSFSAAHGEPATLAEWIAPAVPGEVAVVPELGPPLRIDVVDPSRITDTAIDFQLAGGIGHKILEPGEAYRVSPVAANRIAPMVRGMYVDGVRLCSPPAPAWFELETLTPEVCQIVALHSPYSESNGGVLLWGDVTGQAACLRRDGTCSLTLRAPVLSASGGLPVSLAASFHDVANLQEW